MTFARRSVAKLGLALAVLVFFTPALRVMFSEPAFAASVAAAAARTLSEAAFLRTVDRANTLNLITGDLVRATGLHVAYACTVERVVQRGVVLGDCGSAAEPIDVFIHMPAAGLRAGHRMRILGVVEPPAAWTDVSGHTVYYAFIRAVFVDPLR